MKTIADFQPPYSAEIVDNKYGPPDLEVTRREGWGSKTTWYRLAPGDEAAAINRAWKDTYGEEAYEIDTLREVNAELLKALQTISRMTVLADDVVNRHTLVGCVETARAAIQKAEGR